MNFEELQQHLKKIRIAKNEREKTRFCSACNCEHEIVYVSGIKMIGCPKYPKNKPPTVIIEDDWIEKMKGRK